MKTKEELNALKEEVEALNKKLTELSEEEQEQVMGGKADKGSCFECPEKLAAPNKAICNRKCYYFSYVTAADGTDFTHCSLYHEWINGPF